MHNAQLLDLPYAHEKTGPIVLCDVPYDLLESLSSKVNMILKNRLAIRASNFGEKLVGQIDGQIRFADFPDLFKFTEEIAKEFFDMTTFSKQLSWVNLQKKTEYNPSHTHDGTLSYVIYLSIPYEFENEDRLPNTSKSNAHCNGRFEFTYVTQGLDTNVYLVQADKKFNGKMLMFNSNLRHGVYPFYTSDDFRISLAGNIHK